MDMSQSVARFGFTYTVLATLFIALVVFITTAQVGRMRRKHDVKAPDTIGPDAFNRVFRTHQNMIEQTVMFLPVLWVFAATVSDAYAGILGSIWAVGRLMYSFGYWKDPSKRMPGFMIGFIAFLVTLAWSLVAVICILTE